MDVSSDVMDVIRILNDEGFGALAGELLEEISLGREIEPEDAVGEESVDAMGDEDVRGDQPTQRVPIPKDEQLRVAMHILQLRLVEPVRRLAEAERLAGQIAGSEKPGPKDRAAKPLRVEFAPPTDDKAQVRLVRQAAPGSQDEADELGRLLNQIAARQG